MAVATWPMTDCDPGRNLECDPLAGRRRRPRGWPGFGQSMTVAPPPPA